jgi:nucleoside-diphosphate-sugar epimerase
VLAQPYASSYRLPVVIGRFGNIFGAGDLHWSRLIPGTIRRLLRNEPPVIRVHPRGHFRRDFLDIKDVIRAYMALWRACDAPANHGKAFNFAPGGSWSVPEVVQTLQRLLGKEHYVPQIIQTAHAVLRLDGDYYTSTLETLTALYPKLSPGGFVIIDHWRLDTLCGEKDAVLEFRRAHRITDKIIPIDWHGAYWRKPRHH